MPYPNIEKVIEYLKDKYKTIEEEIYMKEQDLSRLKDGLDKTYTEITSIGLLPEDEPIPEKLIPVELIEECKKEEQEKLEKWKKSVGTKE